MRKVIDLQMEFWKKDISDIKFDLRSRDEIPKLLIGLQYIFITPEVRDEVLKVLSDIVPQKKREAGRPGMNLWKILVLGTIRVNGNCDYDKVHELANNHRTLRLILGHDETDTDSLYALQTVKDNVSLLTPQMLDEVNQIVIQTGQKLAMGKNDSTLKASCDSFVVKTDVHYPTDSNLLYDAMRKMITAIAIICSEIGVTQWRQSHHNVLKVKALLRNIQKLKLSTSKDDATKVQREAIIVEAHENYIQVCHGLTERVIETITILREMGFVSPSQDLRLTAIEDYIGHARRQIDQIRRRVILGEKIPHSEKVFSIFEPHTEWISKGKAGVPQELGLRVCVLKDQNGFILHHRVMHKQTDDKVAVTMVQEAKDKFPGLISCSFDKGFYTPYNRDQLGEIIENVILPKKGKLSAKDKEIEHNEEFIKSRHQHSSVESAINALENHGLDRCLDHGLHGFERYVALAVVARNIQLLGHLIQQKELKREKRRRAA
ncbi:MAG: ISNCY family transposase [Candidatus Riflebacteria bacterium]|nr:ISNCY family transposase [Candidatus Riflebacteria bacterium]